MAMAMLKSSSIRAEMGQSRMPRLKGLVSILAIVALHLPAAFALLQPAPQTPRATATTGTTKKAFSTRHNTRFLSFTESPPISRTSNKHKRQSPLFQSSECANVESSSAPRWLDTTNANLANLGLNAAKYGRIIPSLLSSSTEAILTTLKKCWWCLPMMLALVPPYYALFHRTVPSMPSFWPLVKLDAVFHSPYAAFIIGVFLLSNVAYFVSGAYLYLRYHILVPADDDTNQGSFRRDPLLGGAVLTAGTVSTVFHSIQALGPQSLAECMCFIDHGVAISSVLYFWFRCGSPSRRTWLLSLAGLATLSITHWYTWLHSTWHLLSASAAVVWARDGLGSISRKEAMLS